MGARGYHRDRVGRSVRWCGGYVKCWARRAICHRARVRVRARARARARARVKVHQFEVCCGGYVKSCFRTASFRARGPPPRPATFLAEWPRCS